jgi:hypothetical protein
MRTILNFIISVVVMVVLTSSVYVVYLDTQNKTYCQGWEKGYVEGWCYKDLNCISPIVPICPIPDPNFNTYDYGVNDGFIEGRKKRNR